MLYLCYFATVQTSKNSPAQGPLIGVPSVVNVILAVGVFGFTAAWLDGCWCSCGPPAVDGRWKVPNGAETLEETCYLTFGEPVTLGCKGIFSIDSHVFYAVAS